MATVVRLKYIQRFRDRHGRERFYVRQPGRKRVPLPGEPGSPQFMAAYHAALAQPAVKSGPAPRSAPGTFGLLISEWYADAKFRQLGDTTKAVYRRLAERLRVAHGTKPVAMLDAKNIRRIVAEHAETPAAANHILRMFRLLLAHAVREGWRDDNPARDVDRLKEAGEGVRAWTEDEIAAYEARWPVGTKARLAFDLLLYTGQRRSDIVRMGRQNIRGEVLDVRQVKTKARLAIPIHRALAESLGHAPAGHLTFLVTEQGAAFTPGGFYNAFVNWAEDAGLSAGFAPHGGRKAAARRLAEAGCTAHQIASITGHKTLAEVERYTRAVDQAHLAVAAMKRIGGDGSGT